MPVAWLHDAPSKDVARGPARIARDVEGLILSEQDEWQNGE